MLHIRFTAVAIAIIATIPGAATSQSRADSGAATRAAAASAPLVLGALYRAARLQNPRVEAAAALASAAHARVASASLPPDPQLQLGFMNYMLPGLDPMDPLGMTQLQLMQMLPLGGKLGLSGRIARAQAAAADARAGESWWEIRTQVAMAFYDLYETERALAVSRETVRLVQDAARTAESMYRVGEGRQADVLRAQVQLARMTEDTLRMQAMLESMRARLDALLDRGGPVTAAVTALPAFPDTVPSLDSLRQLALSSRPMLDAGARELDAARQRERLARREIWPDLQVGLQYGQRSGEMETERMGSLMLGASVPIFAGRRQLRMRDEAAAMRRMAEADLAAMRAATRGGLATAYAELRRARRLASLYRTTILAQAEAAAASALAAYRVGSVDFMALLDSRMAVNEYRQELARLESDEGRAWAELEMLTGRELIDPDNVAAAPADGGKR